MIYYSKLMFRSVRKSIFSCTAQRWLLLPLLVFLAMTSSAIAQNKQLTGSVKNNEGEPLVSAGIVVKGTSYGTTTDENGNFRISFPASVSKPVLVVTMVSYKEKEVSVSGNDPVNIVLDRNEKALEEVIVTGYTNQKKGKCNRLRGRDIIQTTDGCGHPQCR